MKYLIIPFFLFSILYSNSQPQSFSWYSEEDSLRYNYISPAKDQGEQSPCHIFAAVAAVEAMCHIYYNKPFSSSLGGINLSEAETSFLPTKAKSITRK